MKNEFYKGIEALVHRCADLQTQEHVLVISNPQTSTIAMAVCEAALKVTKNVRHQVVEEALMHGQDPPADLAWQMLSSDVIFCLTRQSLVHTQARHQACLKGSRFLSLPDYSMEVLESPAMRADFRKLSFIAQRIADIFTKGDQLRLLTKKGTLLTASIKGRVGNPAPGWCWAPGSLASPPDAEANVALSENNSHGMLVVDGSVPCPQLGLLRSPLTLNVENGRVVNITGEKSEILNHLFDQAGPLARVLAEFGLGLNPLAKLCGSMLEDEGCLGTAHIGIGSNSTIGGKNNVPFHLDHVIREATVEVDGTVLMEEGSLRADL